MPRDAGWTAVATPRELLDMRERNARWCAAHRKTTPGSQPWLAGQPPFWPHLPGFAQTIVLDPAPHWPIALRNTRALHGALTAILSVPHRSRFPNFTLANVGAGWAVYWHREEAERLPSEVRGVLFDVPTTFRFGPRLRLRAPRVEGRGHRVVVVEAVTPVVITCAGREKVYTRPTDESLHSALSQEFPNRISEDAGWSDDLRERWSSWARARAMLRLVEAKTEPVRTPLGGKYGVVAGWVGTVTLDVNATSLWLFRVAERMGLGSRVGFGFGQIRVREA